MQRSHVVDAYATPLQPPARIFDRWLAARVQRAIAPAAVRLELWDGSSPYARDVAPIGSVLVHDRATLIALIVDPAFASAMRTPPVVSKSVATSVPSWTR